jgi:hypothetical protein
MGRLILVWSCREVSRRLASGEFDEGPAVERWLARLHLIFVCGHCRRFRRQLSLLGRAARRWSEGVLDAAAQAELEHRILVRLLGS